MSHYLSRLAQRANADASPPRARIAGLEAEQVTTVSADATMTPPPASRPVAPQAAQGAAPAQRPLANTQVATPPVPTSSTVPTAPWPRERALETSASGQDTRALEADDLRPRPAPAPDAPPADAFAQRPQPAATPHTPASMTVPAAPPQTVAPLPTAATPAAPLQRTALAVPPAIAVVSPAAAQPSIAAPRLAAPRRPEPAPPRIDVHIGAITLNVRGAPPAPAPRASAPAAQPEARPAFSPHRHYLRG